MADVTVKVNDQIVIFPDQQPEIKDQRLMIPLRGVFNAIGYPEDNITWDDTTKTVTIQNSQYKLTFVIGNTVCVVTSSLTSREITQITMQTAPYLSDDGRTMLPLADLLSGLYYTISWDMDTRTASIVAKDPVIPDTPRNFEILSNNSYQFPDNFSNVSVWGCTLKADNFDGSLEYTSSDDQTFLFCNYPETMVDYHIEGDSEQFAEGWLGKDQWLGDDKYYLNKAVVRTKNLFIYVSYDMRCSQGKVFAVRVRNNSTNKTTITNTSMGYEITDNGHYNVGMDVYHRYKRGQDTIQVPLIIDGDDRSWHWLIDDGIYLAPNKFLEVLANYTVECPGTPDLTVEIFMASSLETIPEDTMPLPVSQDNYCVGFGYKYYLTTNKTYKVSEINTYVDEDIEMDRSVFHSIACAKESGNPGERIELHLAQDPTTTVDEFKSGGFGPYAVTYDFRKLFINDSLEKIKIVGYLIGGISQKDLDINPKEERFTSHCAGITSGSDSKCVFLGEYAGGVNLGLGDTKWKFFESRVLNPWEVEYIQYQYMMLSKGNKHARLQYQVVSVN